MKLIHAIGKLAVLSFLVGGTRGRILRGNRGNEKVTMDDSNILDVGGVAGIARTLSNAAGDFSTLTCNSAMSACTPWSTTAQSYTNGAGKVTVPCGKCLTMDKTDASTLDIVGGLHIEGKLDIPNTARVTIRTPFIIVEGELAMISTEMVTGTPNVKVVMTGDSDVTFVPNSQNAAACGGPGQHCSVGRKAIAVAGGKLNIHGLPPTCPSWVHIEDEIIEGAPNTDEFPKPAEMNETMGCNSGTVILHENFVDQEHIFFTEWTGGLGSVISIKSDTNITSDLDDGTPYMHITNRKQMWQGPAYDIRPIRPCFIPDQIIYFTAKIRMKPVNATEKSFCMQYGFNCPFLLYTYMNSEKNVNSHMLVVTNTDDVPPDGEWFYLMGQFSLNEFALSENNVYGVFSVEGPEDEIDLSLSEIKFEYPNAVAFPSPDAVCAELANNGDAEFGLAGSVFVYPFKSFVGKDAYLSVKKDNSTDNQFFSISQRSEKWASLSFDLVTGCVVEGSQYYFSSKIWINAPESDIATAVLKLTNPDGSVSHKNIVRCPETSANIGWVTCNDYYQFDAEDAAAIQIHVLFVLMEDKISDIYYDDITFKFASGGNLGVPIFPDEVEDCWGVGAEVFFPSNTLDSGDAAVVTIVKSYETFDGRRSFDFDTAVSGREALSNNPDYAGESALLSRNIHFESDDLIDITNGAHLIVFHTPDVEQILEGVAFKGFGQQGVADRFPINFLMNGNAQGSIIRKNSIRDSNSRCINVQGTDGLQVSDNVAYNTFGHCYVIADGGEKLNVFERNLGGTTKAATMIIAGEGDNTPATFLIRSPTNTFRNNVAAGSEESGFWFNVKTSVGGYSQNLFPGDYNPSEFPVTEFVGNVAHSNKGNGIQTWPGTAPDGYSPLEKCVLENTRVYRNSENGFFIAGGQNIVVKGGLIADNKIGVNINWADKTILTSIRIIGFSTQYQRIVKTLGYQSLCSTSSEPIFGVKLYPNSRDSSMDGTSVEDVHFSKFSDSTGCEGSTALTVNDVPRDLSFDSKTAFQRLTFDDDVRPISICDADEAYIDSIQIKDDGSLNPSDSSSGNVVAIDPSMTLLGLVCSPIPRSCAQYCFGVCGQKVSVRTNTQGTADVVLRISDEKGNVLDRPPKFRPRMNTETETLWNNFREYVTTLPSGNYTAEFRKITEEKEEGEEPKIIDEAYWPGFAHVTLGNPPEDCSNYLDSFELPIPETNLTNSTVEHVDVCDQLIRNSDFKEGNAQEAGWHHTGGGLKYVETVFGTALSTLERTAWGAGPAYFFDTRCMMEGETYKIDLQMRLEFTHGGGASCDVNAKYGNGVCPRANLKTIASDSSGGETVSFKWNVAGAAGPWEDGQWNRFTGIFQVDETMANAENVILFFERLRTGVEIQLSAVTVKRLDTDYCADLIYNGDFEDGHFAGWSYTGQAKLDITSPGAPNFETGDLSSHALITQVRNHWFWGQSQEIRKECLVENQQYAITGRVKLDSTVCDPFHMHLKPGGCPSVFLMVMKDGGTELYQEIGQTVGPYTDDYHGWQYVTGVFKATPAHLNGDSVVFYVGAGTVSENVAIDDFSIFPITGTNEAYSSCDNLIRNGDFEIGDARGYNVIGGGALSMQIPGYNSSVYALLHSERESTFYGIRQVIDTTCLEVGSVWEIKARFKILDGDTLEPVQCNRQETWGDAMCPIITVHSVDYEQGDVETYHAWPDTDKLPSDWTSSDFNLYLSNFTVTEKMSTYPLVSVYVDKVVKNLNVILDDFSIRPLEVSAES